MIVFVFLLGINFLKRITKNVSFSFIILAMNRQVDYFAEELDQKYFQQRIHRPISPQAHLIGFWSFLLILLGGYIVVNYSWFNLHFLDFSDAKEKNCLLSQLCKLSISIHQLSSKI